MTNKMFVSSALNDLKWSTLSLVDSNLLHWRSQPSDTVDTVEGWDVGIRGLRHSA